MQKFDEEKLWQMGHGWNFGEQNFDELIVGFIGETLRGKVSRENFDEY